MSRDLNTALFDTQAEALAQVLGGALPADAVLQGFFRGRPRLGVRDRGAVAEAVYGTLRHYESLVCLASALAPRRLLLSYWYRVQGRSVRDLLGLCGDDPERQWLTALPTLKLPDTLSVRAHLPPWVVESLLAFRSPDEVLKLGQALTRPAPLDLRVNTLKANRNDVIEALARVGIEASPTPWSPWGLRVTGHPGLQTLTLFKDGWIEIQDEGSQLLGVLVAPRRREAVVDFCAGAGGKSLLLGALMQDQGRLYAFDVSAARLDRLRPRLKRSGLSNLTPVVIQNQNDPRVQRLRGKIDRVLVDAPCSGLGTLRRNPDLKWRQSAEALPTLIDKQREILAAASRLVRPGGRLVYATCSFLPAENQHQVAHFEAEHPEFQRLNCAELLAGIGVVPDFDDGTLQLWPHHHGTDGFYAAVWERAP